MVSNYQAILLARMGWDCPINLVKNSLLSRCITIMNVLRMAVLCAVWCTKTTEQVNYKLIWLIKS